VFLSPIPRQQEWHPRTLLLPYLVLAVAGGGAVVFPTLDEGDVHRFEVGGGDVHRFQVGGEGDVHQSTRNTLFRRTLVDNQMLGLA
jgi:hypothetical protein